MPGSKSDYLEKITLDLFLGGVAFAPPQFLYLALSTAAYSDSATGGAFAEVVGTEAGTGVATGYGRRQVENNLTNWPTATGTNPTTKINGQAFTFAVATGNWGTVTAFYILDAVTGGNILYGGDLTLAKQILAGDTATFAANSITVTED